MNVLSISPVMPYDKIGHAGGKTYNYYIKKLAEASKINLSVLFFTKKNEIKYCDLDKYGISYSYILTSGTVRADAEHFLLDKLSAKCRHSSFFSAYKQWKVMRYLDKLHSKGSLPDIIELEWTNFALFAHAINRKYPQIKLIASEHDVSFLGAERKYMWAIGRQRAKLKKRYTQLKKDELEALQLCDIAMPHNIKDRDLLIKNDIPEEKIFVLTPYYHNMGYIKRENINHDILFWGAMNRPENYEAAIWFIDKVMPLLKDTDIRFVVAGNRPPKELIDKSSDRVEVTGFVEDETPYFSHSLCFVSPLLTGAGIKVKVIEALSAGIPILTNDIGIEGIPAVDGESYFNCASPDKYAEVIKKLLNKEIDSDRIRTAQASVISNNFDLNMSTVKYIDMIKGLVTDDCREN